MANTDDYELNLLKAVLPAYKHLADIRANSTKDTEVQLFTYWAELHYELARLQSLVSNYDGLQAQPLRSLLKVFEKRLDRARLDLKPRNILWPNPEYEALWALRKIVMESGVLYPEVELFSILHLHTSKTKNRKRIIKCIKDCNAAFDTKLPPPIDSEHGHAPTHSIPFPSLFSKIPDYTTLVRQVLCNHYHYRQSCDCSSRNIHNLAQLNLTTHQSFAKKATEEALLEILLSTDHKERPWQEAEVQVGGTRQGPRKNLKIRITTPKSETLRLDANRWEVESIYREIRCSGDVRLRFVIHDNKLLALKPVRPMVNGLNGGKMVSLKDLIQNRSFNFKRKEKYNLAFLIANSILHLYSGTWLEKGWSKEHIWFLTQCKNGQTIPDLQTPYISMRCVSSKVVEDEQARHRIHHDPDILALGIVLLEIAHGISIESRRKGDVGLNTDLLNADALLTELRSDKANYIQNHIDAIQICLMPDELFRRSSAPGDIRRRLYEKVVHPLKVIYDQYKINNDKLDANSIPDEETPRAMIPYQARELPGGPRHNDSSTTFQSNLQALNSLEGLMVMKNISPQAISAANWFKELERQVHPLLSDDPTNKVKIAILDSGIDLPTEEIKLAFVDNIMFKDFLGDGSDSSIDLVGHGTHAAGLLLKVAPNAEIYVARITEDGQTFNPDIISKVLVIIQSAFNRKTLPKFSKAIIYATDEWKVDIITMAFGFSDRKAQIHDALIYASSNPQKSVILFGSASNYGNKSVIPWPARAEQVICIHATDGNGNMSHFSHSPRHEDFCTVGQAVESYWPSHLHQGEAVTEDGQVLRDGASFATSIAAGIAAVVLEYARPRLPKFASSMTEKHDEHILKILSSNAGMKAVFELMKGERHRHKCIIPWKLLHADWSERTICEMIMNKLEKDI